MIGWIPRARGDWHIENRVGEWRRLMACADPGHGTDEPHYHLAAGEVTDAERDWETAYTTARLVFGHAVDDPGVVSNV